MPKKPAKTKSKNGNGVNLGIEAELWQAADCTSSEHLGQMGQFAKVMFSGL